MIGIDVAQNSEGLGHKTTESSALFDWQVPAIKLTSPLGQFARLTLNLTALTLANARI